MPALQIKPLSWLKPDRNQPRKHFDEAELRLLGESLATSAPANPRPPRRYDHRR